MIPKLKVYECWKDDEGIALFQADTSPDQISVILTHGAQLYYRIYAATWEEAMAIHHLRLGYEPYKPMGKPKRCQKCQIGLIYLDGDSECWYCNTSPKENQE